MCVRTENRIEEESRKKNQHQEITNSNEVTEYKRTKKKLWWPNKYQSCWSGSFWTFLLYVCIPTIVKDTHVSIYVCGWMDAHRNVIRLLFDWYRDHYYNANYDFFLAFFIVIQINISRTWLRVHTAYLMTLRITVAVYLLCVGPAHNRHSLSASEQIPTDDHQCYYSPTQQHRSILLV